LTEANNFIIVCSVKINLLQEKRIGGATQSIFHLLFIACSETNLAKCIALWSSVILCGSSRMF